MNVENAHSVGVLLANPVGATGRSRVGLVLAQRSPDRVIGVPQSGLLATNLSEQKGA